jgi:hypothetical protein
MNDCQGRGSLASHLRFACEIGAVLGVFSHDSISLASLIRKIRPSAISRIGVEL